MSKELHEAIMKISRLRYKFLKLTTDTNKRNNSKQRKLCKKLLKNTKKSYFKNLDTKKITDNRSLCRTVTPLFTQNSSKDEKINLIDDSKIISSDEEICETFNQFFSNVVPTLNIPKPKSFPTASDNLNPIMSVIKSFEKHSSMVKIKAKAFDSNFHFRKTSCNEIEKIISNLNIKKSCQQGDIPTKIIKLNKDLIAKFIADCLDHSLLVVKLHWYGLSPLPLKLIFSYFSNRTHRTKIKECFSNRLKIEYGVPQGSVLSPLLFNINSIDMFYKIEDSDIENYADDTEFSLLGEFGGRVPSTSRKFAHSPPT